MRWNSVTTTVLFKEFDPWHPTDATGFNKTGYVTKSGVVIYPRRSRIARKSVDAIMRQPHRFVRMSAHSRAEQIEIFFTNNIINTAMYVMAMERIGQPTSGFWDNPIKLPILNPISRAEHDKRWNKVPKELQRGDAIFTVDTQSISSRLITYLDQGTWSHVGIYTGEGRISEAITSGVTERSIENYHDPRYRLGIYRAGGSEEQLTKMIEALRSQIGKPYASKKVLRLGVRMLLGIWPNPNERYQITPNRLIPIAGFRLVEVI
jgi:hypothetical protein